MLKQTVIHDGQYKLITCVQQFSISTVGLGTANDVLCMYLYTEHNMKIYIACNNLYNIHCDNDIDRFNSIAYCPVVIL